MRFFGKLRAHGANIVDIRRTKPVNIFLCKGHAEVPPQIKQPLKPGDRFLHGQYAAQLVPVHHHQTGSQLPGGGENPLVNAHTIPQPAFVLGKKQIRLGSGDVRMHREDAGAAPLRLFPQHGDEGGIQLGFGVDEHLQLPEPQLQQSVQCFLRQRRV